MAEPQPLPWVANLEIVPGAIYTGFLDRSGRPAGLGCLRYATPQAQTSRTDRVDPRNNLIQINLDLYSFIVIE